MTKLSHKALKEMGKLSNGYYFDGNIYAHENRVHYLTSYRLLHTEYKSEILEEIAHHEHEILTLAEQIADLGADSVQVVQIAYACGIYGNLGQLHKIDYYKNGNIIKSITLYV